jgi:hypothetical protein
MNILNLIYELSLWLRTGERWNVITLVICVLAAAYVIALMIRRARVDHDVARAAAQDSLRIVARRYRESARD